MSNRFYKENKVSEIPSAELITLHYNLALCENIQSDVNIDKFYEAVQEVQDELLKRMNGEQRL